MLSHFSCAQLFVTLCTVAHQVPLSVGCPRQENWSELPLPSPGDLPNLGIKPAPPALAGGFFTTSTTWEAPTCCQFSSVQSLSRVQLFATPWTAACQAFLSITNSWSLLKLMSIGSVMPSNHLILCHPLLLLPSIFRIRVFSNESAPHIRWPKYWSFSLNISPSNEHPELISFRMDWLDLLAVQGSLKSLLQHHSSKALVYRSLINTWQQKICNINFKK